MAQIFAVALEQEKVGRHLAGPFGALFGEGFAGEANDLHGARDATAILTVDGCVSGGITLEQFCHKRFQIHLCQLRSQRYVRLRSIAQAFKPRAEIQSGAATKNGGLYFFFGFFRLLHKTCRIEGFG